MSILCQLKRNTCNKDGCKSAICMATFKSVISGNGCHSHSEMHFEKYLKSHLINIVVEVQINTDDY